MSCGPDGASSAEHVGWGEMTSPSRTGKPGDDGKVLHRGLSLAFAFSRLPLAVIGSARVGAGAGQDDGWRLELGLIWHAAESQPDSSPSHVHPLASTMPHPGTRQGRESMR
jgi:hypothetical protein